MNRLINYIKLLENELQSLRQSKETYTDDEIYQLTVGTEITIITGIVRELKKIAA